MTSFVRIPEALDYIADQSWLTPDNLGHLIQQTAPDDQTARSVHLGWREATRQIAAILRRI